MKIIICGAGQVGFGIAERLSAEDNDIAVIDTRADLVQHINDVLDVRAFHGNGAHPDVLVQAGAREADMLIAVTHADEINMVACQVAHTLFDIPTKIARVRAQAYLTDEWSKLFARSSMAIDYIISPEIEIGETVLRRLELPGAFETMTFADGLVQAIGITCLASCPVVDTPIRQLSELFPDLTAVIVAITRQRQLLVPTSADQLKVGDDVYLVVPSTQVARALEIFGHDEKKARRIIIAGGGNIGFYVARALDEKETLTRTKVIEASRGRATDIAERLSRIVVLHGSALSENLLREAEVQNAETLVAVTNDDQVNILTSVLAKQLGCQRSLCLVNSSGYTNMIRSFGIDAQVNPRAITVSRILQFVRRGRIRTVHSIHDGAAELLEAEALETSTAIGKSIRQLGLSDGIRFGAIVRGGKVLRPTADTELEVKDRAIILCRADHVHEVEQIFRVSPEYF